MKAKALGLLRIFFLFALLFHADSVWSQRDWDSEPLIHAAIYGETDKAREILSNMPPRVAGRYDRRDDMLRIAAERGHADIVKALLESGADVNVPGFGISNGGGGTETTALHLAAAAGNKEIAEILIKAGAVVDRQTGFFRRDTPLLSLMQKWCFYGLPPPQWDTNAQMAVLNAKETAKLLLEHGADVFATNRGGTSPLQVTVKARRLDWAELLLANSQVLPKWTNQPESLLHTAARLGLPKAVDALIQKGMSVNSTNDQGLTPLQLTALLDPVIRPAGSTNDIAAIKREIANRLDMAGARADVFSAAGLGDLDTLRKLAAQDPVVVKSRDALGRTPLHWAALTGQNGAADALLALGADVVARDKAERQPLHEASLRGDTNTVTLLLRNKAPVSSPDQQGRTPLHDAAEKGNIAVARLLVDAGAVLNSKDKSGSAALDLAAKGNHADIVRLLLDEGAKLNKGGDHTTTPLHSEIASGNLDATKALIRQGSRVDAPDAQGKRPLHLAVERKDMAMVDLLLKSGADINGRDTNGDSVLHYCLPAFSDPVASPPPTPSWRYQLIQFVGLTNASLAPPPTNPPPISFVNYLLEHKADPNATNLLGRTPLHMLGTEQPWNGRDAKISPGDPESNIVSALVAAGASLDARDRDGLTPLHLAADKGSLHAAAILLGQGAKVNLHAVDGRTPLHFAAQHMNWMSGGGWSDEQLNMVTLLLKYGADFNAQDKEGRTPLDVMVTSDESYKASWIPLLIEAGANVNLKDKAGRTPLHAVLAGKWPWHDAAKTIQLLVAAGADVNARDNNGQTPVHYLAKLADSLFFLRGVPDALLTEKVDVNVADKDGNTPLRLAALVGNQELMKILTDRGARPTQGVAGAKPAVASSTPTGMAASMFQNVHRAARFGDLESVKNFLNAAPELANQPEANTGVLPLQIAASAGNSAMVEVMLAKGANLDPVSAVFLGRDAALADALRKTPDLAKSNWQGSSLVFYAARAGQAGCLSLLLEAGADVNAKGGLDTPLFAALSGNHTNIAELLRQRGARLNLYDAVKLGDLETLSSLNADPRELSGSRGFITTPLIEAVRAQQPKSVRFLVENGADPSVQNDMGFTPLHMAACLGLEEMARLLVELKAPLESRQIRPNERARQFPAYVDTGNTPLHYAAQTGRTNIVELLLANRADANSTNAFGRTPLFLTRYLGVSPDGALGLLVPRPPPGPIEMPVIGPGGRQIQFKPRERPFPSRGIEASAKQAIVELLLKHGAKDEETRDEK